MMSRGFTTREKVTLLILAVILICALYYLVIHEPVTSSIAEAQARQAELADKTLIEETKNELMLTMLAELESVGYGELADQITPDYDNTQAVVSELNTALLTADEYNMNFKPVVFNETLALREIEMTFATRTYNNARAIIRTLKQGPYRCEISTLKIDPSGAENIMDGPVKVALSITYYEIV